MAKQRMRQINSELRSYFATALLRELELPAGAIVSVTRVSTTKDLHYATVYLSITPDAQTGTVLLLIKKNSAALIGSVADHITFRSVPHFRFVLDDTERKAAHIEALLDSIM